MILDDPGDLARLKNGTVDLSGDSQWTNARKSIFFEQPLPRRRLELHPRSTAPCDSPVRGVSSKAMSLIDIAREHRIRVNESLTQGSNPRTSFFLLTGVSTLIAAFGLLMDSTAVVIGAMLVAPLMTPILGISLSLVQGNPRLLGHALRAEVIGVVVAIGVATLLGLAIPYFDATPEMLSRTRPNLFDLLVALFAGFAGAYALMDEKLSPALPGVAISTAIVPPLANCGLCLSLGAYEGAVGSALLFFTNFLTILLVSDVVFWMFGMGDGALASKTFVRRFGLAVLGFIVIGVLLGRNLVNVIQERRMQRDVQLLLREELATHRISELDRLVHRATDDGVFVVAHVHAPRVLSPRQVKDVETRMEAQLGRDLDLNLRMTLTRNVSATGSVDRQYAETLDGFSFSRGGGESSGTLHVAEQVIREFLGDKVGQKLVELQSFPWNDTTVLVAEVTGTRRLRRAEISQLRSLLRDRVSDDQLYLGVLQGGELFSDEGPVHFDFTTRRKRTPEEEANRAHITALGAAWLEERGYIESSTSQAILDGAVHALFETHGPRSLTPQDIESLEQHLRNETGAEVHARVLVLSEIVVSTEGYETLEQVLSRYGTRIRAAYDVETRALIESWR